ncbi:alkaline phosphatase PafA [Flagellimonas meridianipacifica]|uniref:Type I phosphodiesterase/nucleotide pyrophosphatase n=1 Tax=Flagellimonas meridianipacifica TaxID=1080225 RepID=A0A2T0M7X9_9FLAO|nr:alkaline phosphatase PafA [Allomuricauda pacifica]PRX53646.1 type I phosphodiesterase/nucleotide pyrophosphatase [Allomuricauda pacifica]
MGKNYFLLLVFVFFSCVGLQAQRNKKKTPEPKPIEAEQVPKLVVGIIVEQMRYDYLTRFWNHYSEGGFKRLIKEGFNCKNHHINHAPTSTAPSLASIYTGATPSIHGIIGNTWYDKTQDMEVYGVEDKEYSSVGTFSNAGKMSPHRMLSTTITDQLRLHTQKQGKVIAVALKDVAAVLSGGHMTNAAYWFDGGEVGKWITSSYYMSQLPQWVSDFNSSDAIKKYKKEWNTLKDIGSYVESGPDNNVYETPFENEASPIFPHNTPSLLSKEKDFDVLKYTPYGNNITTDFALEVLEKESLGVDSTTDFLAISFSSTDYVGQKFGLNSKEIQDTYLRLDLDLERMLKALDEKVGVGQYTLFLTSDYGGVREPAYLRDQKVPAGYIDLGEMRGKFNEFLRYKYGTTDVVQNISNFQVFLNHRVIENLDIDLGDAQEEIALELLGYDKVNQVYTAFQMWQNEYTSGIPYLLQKGYHQKRSGDIFLVPKPGFAQYGRTDFTKDAAMIYDTHMPLLFFGNGIKQGATTNRTEVVDIAPTISTLLGIAFPNGTTGNPIGEVLK